MKAIAKSVCRSCGTALSITQSIRGLCDDPECRRKDVPYQEQLRRQAIIQTIQQQIPESWRSLPVALLPRNTQSLTPLSQIRIAAFREFLSQTVTQAKALSESAAETTASTNGIPANQADLLVLDAGCALCGGECCQTGGNTAWLEPATIQRLNWQSLAISEQRIIEHYLSYLPHVSYENSCIYHAERGCTLPRKMRSNVCNQFLCRGLSEVWQRLSSTPSGHCVAASVIGNTVEEIALVDALGSLQKIISKPETKQDTPHTDDMP